MVTRGYAKIVLIGLLILGLFCGGALAESAPVISNVVNNTPTFNDVDITYDVNQSDASTQIRYGTDSSLTSFTLSDWDNATAYQITLSSLSDGTKYYYSVYAYNNTNNSYFNNTPIYNFTTTTPSKPVITNVVNSTPTFNSVDITYDVDQSDASTQIRYGTDSSLTSFTLSDWDNATAYQITLSSLSDGTKYYYSVYGYSNTNNSYFNNTPIYNFTTATPSKPIISNVANSAPTFNSVDITYDVDQSDANTQIRYGTDSSLTSFTLSDWDNATAYQITLSSLNDGTKYYYSVYGYSNTNSSYFNNTSIYNFTTATPSKPVISGITAEPPTATTVTITYDVDQNDANTQIRYGTNSSLTSYDLSDWDNTTPYQITLSSLSDGTTYYYSVYAYNNANNSYYDNFSIKSFTTLSKSGDRIWEEGMSLNYIWNAMSYSGFYYDLDSGFSSETMTIQLGGISDRSISSGDLKYSTTPITTDFEHGGWNSYQVIGFMAEKYFAGYTANTTFSNGALSLLSDSQLSKVLIDEDESDSVYSGSAIILEEGYALNVVEIDREGNSVFVTLTKDGSEVESGIVDADTTYDYKTDLGSSDDVPIIAVHFKNIFRGIETNAVFIEGIFQISDEYITIRNGDTYGEMEVEDVSSTEIKMENDGSLSLGSGNTVDIMGKLKILVADSNTLRFAPFVDMSEPGTYELRGTVAENTGYTWTPLNFEGFYYNIDEGLKTETLEVKSLSGSSISSNDLVYTTTPTLVDLEYTSSTGWTKYSVVGFMAEKYFAGYPSGTFEITSAINLMSDGQLSKVLIDDDKTSSIYSGSSLILDEGYTLSIVEIDRDGNQVFVSLSKDGSEKNSGVVNADETYVYKKDLGSSDDVPVIAVHFKSIFRGMETNAVFIEGIFQISDQYITVEDGDVYGKMEVTSTSGTIVMENDDSISLSKGKSIPIMGDIQFKVADDSDVRYYPFVEVETAPSESLDISMPTSVKQGDYVTITVTSRGATVSSVTVKFDDDEVGSTSNDGTLTYKPALAGTYTVTVEKEGYVSATGEVEIISPLDETKKMSIEVSPDVVHEGNQLMISTIKAIGGEAIEGVDVSYDGNSLGTTSSDGTISYTVKEPGMHKLTATKTGFLDAEFNLEVLALEANFEFSNLVISPLEVKKGKDVTITLDASNTGKAAGDYNVDLMINGNLTESRQITLVVDESTTIEFTVAKEEAGTYLVEVNGLSGSFEVLEKSAAGSTAGYVLGILGIFAAAAVGYMFTVGGWTVEMVTAKVAEFIESVR